MLILTAGQESDIGQAEALPAGHAPEVVIADEGYDKQALVDAIESRGAEAVIPPRANRVDQREIDPHLDRERNPCERFRAQAEPFRRVATRYETKAANVLAFAWVAPLMVVRE